MGPPGGCPNAGALDRAPDHVAQASRADRPDGRARGQKDVIRGGDETLALEVPEDRVTDVLRKRQPRLAPPLAGDPEVPLRLVAVAEPVPVVATPGCA